jgi:hypothetical protein
MAHARFHSLPRSGCPRTALARVLAAKLGWIVVARGLVLEDRRKAWVHTLAGTDDDMSRLGAMHRRCVSRSTQGDQKA